MVCALLQFAILAVALQVVRGMAYIHSKGVCHGDLKIGNVLLCNPDPGAFPADIQLGNPTCQTYRRSTDGTPSNKDRKPGEASSSRGTTTSSSVNVSCDVITGKEAGHAGKHEVSTGFGTLESSVMEPNSRGVGGSATATTLTGTTSMPRSSDLGSFAVASLPEQEGVSTAGKN